MKIEWQKPTVRYVISSLIIIFGILIFVSPYIGRLYNYYLEQKMISDWQAGGNNVDTAEAYINLNDAFLEGEDNSDSNLARPDPDYQATMLGMLRIEAANIYLPIVEGTTRPDLAVGAGHLKGTGNIGEPGNAVLCGHRNYAYKILFDYLDKLQKDDLVEITTKDKIYVYQVYESKVVWPNNTSVIKPDPSRPQIITLLTCHPRFVDNKRLIYHAELIETKDV